MERGAADNFKFNTETEFTPILGLLASDLNTPADKVKSSGNEQTASSIQNNHHSVLLSVLAEELNVKPDEIHDFEL